MQLGTTLFLWEQNMSHWIELISRYIIRRENGEQSIIAANAMVNPR